MSENDIKKILKILEEHGKKLTTIENFLSSKHAPPFISTSSVPPNEGFVNLAKKTNLSIDELKNTIRIKNDSIEILGTITGTNSEKQVTVALCLLIAYEEIFGTEWVSSNIISECCRSIGISDPGGNLATNLKKKSELFRKSSTANEYKLTSGIGRKTAYALIKKLATGE